MSIPRRYSFISNRNLLQTSINRFIQRVKNEQSRNSGALLKCIDSLIDRYQPILLEKFNISPNISDQYQLQQEIWDNLKKRNSDATDSAPEQRQKLMQNNKVTYTKQYRAFIRELYPINTNHKQKVFDSEVKYFDLVNNSRKYLTVRHDELYKRYLDLPSPAPQFMKSEDLEALLRKFLLSKKGYANHNVIEGCVFHDNVEGAITAIKRQNEKRLIYNEMCAKIIMDLNNANLPVKRIEKIRMLYLSFFKDREDIIAFVNNEKALGYPEFKWLDYEMIIKLFGQHSSILETLLFLATRHDNFDIMKAILPKVGLGEIIKTPNIEPSDAKLRDISLNQLLGYFAFHIERPEYDVYLKNTLDYITESVPVLKTDTINTIIKLLIDLGCQKEAQLLFEQAFFQDFSNPDNSPENSETISYKRFTPEDAIINTEWLSIYEKLKSITNDQEIIYKLVPTETSFMSFFNEYCKYSGSSEIKQMITIMDKYAKQPLSTRIYTRIFAGFIKRAGQPGWTLDEFVELMTRLINDVDKSDKTSTYLKRLMEDLDINVLSGNTRRTTESNTPDVYENVLVLKLNSLLMDTIFKGLEALLHNQTAENEDYEEALNSLKGLQRKRVYMLKSCEHQDDVASIYTAGKNRTVNAAVLLGIYSIISQF